MDAVRKGTNPHEPGVVYSGHAHRTFDLHESDEKLDSLVAKIDTQALDLTALKKKKEAPKDDNKNNYGDFTDLVLENPELKEFIDAIRESGELD